MLKFRNQKGIISVVIIVLISVMAVGLVAAAWYYETNKEEVNSSKNTVVVNTNSTANVNSVSNVNMSTNSSANVNVSVDINTDTVVGNTSDWQTYENGELNYSIKYPSDWNLDTEYISQGSLYILSKERQQKLDAGEIVRVFDVLVEVYKSSSELPNNSIELLSFENWIEQEADTYGFTDRKSITLDGIQGYQGIGSGHGSLYLIFIQNGDYIYQLETGDTASPTDTEDRIINSINFL